MSAKQARDGRKFGEQGRAAVDVLQHCGIGDYTFAKPGKHAEVAFSIGDERLTYRFACTPRSAGGAAKTVRRDLQNLIENTRARGATADAAAKKKGGQELNPEPPERQSAMLQLNIEQPHEVRNANSAPSQPSTDAAPTITYAGMRGMTAAEWSRVADNPRQRDTAAHAQRAQHLKVLHPSHCKVNMARLPDGTCYKLDGHTRSFIWQSGAVDPPDELYVDVWNCQSIADVKHLYTTFDSKGAVESATDQVFGAIREHDLAFTSDVLRGLRFTAAMRFSYEMLFGQAAAKATSTYDILKYFKPELLLLDKCDPKSRRFHTGVVAAALLTFRKYGPAAVEFWTSFSKGEGTKVGNEMDPVQALEQRMEKLRGTKNLSGKHNLIIVLGLAVSAFERFRHNENYVATGTEGARGAGIKTTRTDSLRKWLSSAKSVKRSW